MSINRLNFTKFFNSCNYTLENSPHIAVAVSGGPDSMALIFILNKWINKYNGKLIGLIVNHNLRDNSYDEAKETSNLLTNLKIKSKILSVNNYKIRKKSMNEARNNRFNLLTDYCKKNNILHLFVGHHRDDNLETFINRKIAGSDFDGLKSIQHISTINNINIIRPLLGYSKKQILKYNKENNIPFIYDPSNINLKYTRPTIRKFLNESSTNVKLEIMTEFNVIKKYSKFYNMMIGDTLNHIIKNCNIYKVELDFNFFNSENVLVSEKIIKKIYAYISTKKVFIKSVKIQVLLKELKKKKFTQFNLSGMIIKKRNNLLVFSRKNH